MNEFEPIIYGGSILTCGSDSYPSINIGMALLAKWPELSLLQQHSANWTWKADKVHRQLQPLVALVYRAVLIVTRSCSNRQTSRRRSREEKNKLKSETGARLFHPAAMQARTHTNPRTRVFRTNFPVHKKSNKWSLDWLIVSYFGPHCFIYQVPTVGKTH